MKRKPSELPEHFEEWRAWYDPLTGEVIEVDGRTPSAPLKRECRGISEAVREAVTAEAALEKSSWGLLRSSSRRYGFGVVIRTASRRNIDWLRTRAARILPKALDAATHRFVRWSQQPSATDQLTGTIDGWARGYAELQKTDGNGVAMCVPCELTQFQKLIDDNLIFGYNNYSINFGLLRLEKQTEQEKTAVALPDGSLALVSQFFGLLSKDATTLVGQLKALESPVRLELIKVLQPAIRTLVQTNPPATYAEKQTLCKSLNQLMAVLGVAIKHPETGQACSLAPIGGSSAGYFMLQGKAGGSRKQLVKNTTNLELTEYTRQEGLSARIKKS